MAPYYYYGYFPFGFLWSILWIIVWVLLAVFIIRLIRGSRHHNFKDFKEMMGNKSSLDILKDRYAKGEIDKAEFDQKKKDLME